jgi:hypothetical protein
MSADALNYPTYESLLEDSSGGSCLSYGPQPVVTDPWAEALLRFFDHVIPRPQARAGAGRVNLLFVLSFMVAMPSLVSVFIEIPLVSNYAFWALMAAYIMLAGSAAK